MTHSLWYVTLGRIIKCWL